MCPRRCLGILWKERERVGGRKGGRERGREGGRRGERGREGGREGREGEGGKSPWFQLPKYGN